MIVALIGPAIVEQCGENCFLVHRPDVKQDDNIRVCATLHRAREYAHQTYPGSVEL